VWAGRPEEADRLADTKEGNRRVPAATSCAGVTSLPTRRPAPTSPEMETRETARSGDEPTSPYVRHTDMVSPLKVGGKGERVRPGTSASLRPDKL
jgi:hypothetical protein